MNQLTYFRFFQDLWRLFRDHLQPVSADEWWQRLIDKADALCERYGAGSFVVKMVSAAVWEIDRIYQRRHCSDDRT